MPHLELEHADALALRRDLPECGQQALAAPRLEDVRERASEQSLGGVAEDAEDRLALVGDRALGVDDRDDVRRVLDERLEALLAGAQVVEPRLQSAGERPVLPQGEDLPDDDRDDHRRSHPGDEGRDLARTDELERARRQSDEHGRVGQPHSRQLQVGDVVIRLGHDPGRLQGGEEHQRIAAEPADVDQASGGVRVRGRQVRERAVRERHRQQAGADQPDEGRHLRSGLARAEDDVEHDRDHDHVSDRVEQADRVREQVAVLLEDRAQHEHPARQQGRAGDHGAVDQRASAARRGRRAVVGSISRPAAASGTAQR